MKKNIEILESEQLMCLDCENNGQEMAWETARNIIYGAKQHRATGLRCLRKRPQQTLRETTHPDFYDNMGNMEIKNQKLNEFKRNKTGIERPPFRSSEEKLERDVCHGSGRRLTRQCKLRTLWMDKRLAEFDLKTGPTVEFS